MILPIVLIATNILFIKGDSNNYQSTYEAVHSGTNNICLGECIGYKGYQECVYDWDGNLASCTILTYGDNTPKRTKRYRTIHNDICYSNCGKYNENYDWCITKTNGIHAWNYCSRKSALKGIETFRTKDKYLTCTDDCAKRSNSSTWCNTVHEPQYCDPMNKVIVFNFLSESGSECATPCELHYGIPHCYNIHGIWKKCYLNPDATVELSLMSKHMNETRNPGVYTFKGYKRCERLYTDLSSKYSMNMEEIAREYEDNYPTVTVRYMDSKNLITKDRNPILSYTVYNTFSNFGDHLVNLPLVIRAVITNHTLRRENNNDVIKQYNEMDPIPVREKYDEKGYFVGPKLGGPEEIFNIFPQSWHHNHGPLTMGYLEADLFNFVNTFHNSYVEYTAIVSYNLNNPKTPFRPTAVGVRVRLYKDVRRGVEGTRKLCDLKGNKITPFMNELENMYFSNDPNFICVLDNANVGNNAV